jgi:hypothetical protein
MGPATVIFAEIRVAPKGEPVGSKVKVPLIVSVPGGTVLVPITGGEKVYVIGAAVTGDGARIAGAARTIAAQTPNRLVSKPLRGCDWRHRVVIDYVP